MPAPERSHRYQKAVLWLRDGTDGYGMPTVAEPVEIRVRWNDKESEMLDKDGNVVALDATAIVVQDIPPGSRMWLGPLEDWLGTGSSPDDTRLMEVRTFDSTPDIKNRNRQRTVGLLRWRARP